MAYVKIGRPDLFGEELKYLRLEYNHTRKRRKTIERRITSLVKRHIPFFVKTSILTSEDYWFVDSGGWVFRHESETMQDKKGELLGHVKNCFPFMGGPRPIWKERKPLNRRRSIKRGF